MKQQAPVHARETGHLSQEIVRFIETEGFEAAREAIKGQRFIELDGDAMIVGQKSEWEVTKIRRNPDGTATCSQSAFSLFQRGRDDCYALAWSQLLSTAHAQLRGNLESFLFPLSLEALDPEISNQAYKAISRVARGVRATTGHGYLSEPTRLGNGTLHKLLGKSKVGQTLAIAGPHATIEHFNLGASPSIG